MSAGLFRVDDVRAHDAASIAAGTPGAVLMARAAAAALQALRARWPVARELLVFCGGGNNGGDGYVLARLARKAGFAVRVVATVAPERLRGDAASAATDCAATGVPIERVMGVASAASCRTLIEHADVIVDALLGIGLAEDVRPDLAVFIDLINRSGRPVLALDVPSGLCADTGKVRGAAIRAALTVTFIARKVGLWVGEGPDHAGDILLADLEVGEPRVVPVLNRLSEDDISESLMRRARTAHKGNFGHVLVIGGSHGMPGAARLAGEAALHAGAGRLSAWVAPESATAVAAGCPELMVRGVSDAVTDDASLGDVDVLAVGPGLGRSEWGRRMFAQALVAARASALPLVLDADALNLLAEQPTLALPKECILTPHPGEAARLLGCSSGEIQQDRLRALRALRDRFAATVVLKGAGTLISGDVPSICDRGCPAMAAPGMGDVLTGVIAALLAQGLSRHDAARSGVLVHALAGERAAGSRDRGVLASEVSRAVPDVLAEVLVGRSRVGG